MTTPRPGWYPDPAGTGTGQQLFRYWNGSSWTDDLGTSSSAPAPEPSREHESSLSGRVGVAAGRTDPAPRPKRVRAAVALTLGVALLIAAGFGGSWLLHNEGQTSRKPLAPGTAQNTPPSDRSGAKAPMGRVDEETGEARIDDISMMLPGDPYEVFAGSTSVKNAFDIVFTSNALVHRHYHGSSNWVATVGLAHVSPAVTDGDDPDAAGKAAMMAVTRHFFGTHHTKLKNLKTSIGTVGSGAAGRRPAVTATVDVYYAIEHLPSTHDQVTVKLVRLDDGSLVAGISSVPNDADPALRRQAAAALETLTVR